MTVVESRGAAGAAGAKHSEREETRRAFPVKSESEETSRDSTVALSRRSELLDFLQPDEDVIITTSSSEFYDSLQALKRKNKQCLLELGLMYQVKLENSHKLPTENKELEDFFQDNGRLTVPRKYHEALTSGNLRRYNSLTYLSVDSPTNKQNYKTFPQSFSRPKSASAAWISSITIPQPFKMTLREAHRKSQLLKSHAVLEKATYKKQSLEEAECQKQFRAQPVPAHIYLPLYQELMEKNEIRRQVETQKRRELLRSTQKPFSFQEKEEKRKEAIRQKVLEILAPTEKSVPKIRKKIPQAIHEPMLGDKLKEAELFRKIRIQMRAKDLLENSWAPIELGNRQKGKESQIASRNREQKLSFLQDNFSFKPRINSSVPDFEKLYWAFQREAINKREIKEATHNKPFRLRTSNLRCKHQVPNQKMMDCQQSSKVPVQRSRSLTCLSSLSSNTLPIHITDAVRKRESAVKSLQQDKQYRENESIRWAEQQRRKCQAMQKSVNCRAKAMDPHKSLEETHKEKLKQNWQNDQKRTKEYKKDLEEMKMRVKNRPYLFEQVTKRGARQGAQRLYRDTLRQFGLNEDFVRSKGREATDLVGMEQFKSERTQKSKNSIDAAAMHQQSQEKQKVQELT
ncbi:protein FAM161B [Eublepharis macularius]|uniref:Protein FAM161B n=1 Tax=Eublepharis macularius TaxID=481883 RepID=A0AA97KPT4_EUBMA|nr:protein FAM161B [Eublepharis macularius]